MIYTLTLMRLRYWLLMLAQVPGGLGVVAKAHGCARLAGSNHAHYVPAATAARAVRAPGGRASYGSAVGGRYPHVSGQRTGAVSALAAG